MKRPGRAIIHTRSQEETRKLGTEMASRLRSGVWVALTGPLGSGKSVFVRGVCAGLGVDEDVLSPTFILYEAFDGRLPVVHVDLYRLEHETEIEALGVFDLLGGDTVVLVEWADRSETLMDECDVAVAFEDEGPNGRRVVVSFSDDVAGAFEDVGSWS